MKRRLLLVLGLLLFAALSFFVVPSYAAPALTPTGDEDIEFEGYIESIDGDEWVIAGRTVFVDDDTKIDERKGPAEVGAYVEVRAEEQDDGSLYATKIKVIEANETPEPTETPDETETPEPTETPDATETPEPTETPDETETPEPTETPDATETPEPTETPDATETPEPTETPHATETPEPTETPDATETPEPTETPVQKVEFKGYIESIGDDAWVIGGQTVLVDANTVIDESEGPAVVGAYVEVKAIRQSDGSLYARRIKVEESHETPEPTETPDATETPEPTETPDATETPEPTETPDATETPEPTETPDPGPRVEFRGVVESISDAQWVISGQTVLVDINTEIDESHGPAQVGATVEVKAHRQADGSLYAYRIKVEEADDDDDDEDGVEIEFQGFIEAVNGDVWVVAGEEVIVDANTNIDEREGKAVVGAYVEVKAERRTDGSLYARRIRVRTQEEEMPEVEWKGAVEAINGEIWTIGGREVLVDARTRLEEENGPIDVGVYVEVKARQQTDGSLWAERIRSRKPEDDDLNEMEWEGVIEAMLATEWSVGGITVTVNAATVIDEREGPAQVGATAKVHAVQQTDGSLLAQRIRIRNRVPDESKIEFRGPIDAMGSNVWVVNGVTLLVDEGTIFENLERAALGAIAEVKARILPDGSLLAISIRIEGEVWDAQREVEWKGALEAFDDVSWTVDGRTVALDAQTVVKGQPRLGALVEVHARVQFDGSFLALRLEVEDEAEDVEWKGVVESIGDSVWQVGGRTVMVDGRTVFDERNGPIGVGVWVEVKAQRQADGSLVALRIKSEDD